MATNYTAARDGLRQKVSSFMAYPSNSSTVLTMPRESKDKDAVYLWCFNLSRMSSTMQFILLTFLTFLFYLVYGYMQELIFRLEGFKTFGWYLTFIQFGYYTVMGIAELQFVKDKRRKIPFKSYLLLAFLTVATMGLSNTSVGYLNYPTQVIFKCCKLIPVLIGGIFIQGKVFSAIDVTACLSMSFGLILFTLADSTVSPNFDSYGILLISLALCADGVIGNVQEKSLKKFGASNGEMVLYSYGLGLVYIFAGLVASGSFLPAFQFCQQYPKETYGYAVIFSLTGYLGLSVVLTLVKSFGALVAVTVTTCRKAVTIILSFMFFTKPFTSQYIWSGLVVLLGIYLNLYSKNKASWDAYFLKVLQGCGLARRKPVLVPENIV